MKPLSLQFSNVSRAFEREVSIDFRGLDAGIYAFVGPNGSGKSTTLELMGPAPFYLSFPQTAERFIEKATGFSWLDYRFELAELEHRIKVNADPRAGSGKGKTDHFWYEPDGTATGPNASDVSLVRVKYLPSPALFLAGQFCAQRTVRDNGSFMTGTKGDRKRLMIEGLGRGDWELRAQRAHLISAGLGAELEVKRRRLEELERILAERPAPGHVALVEEQCGDLAAALVNARNELAGARAVLGDIAAEEQRRMKWEQRLEVLQADRRRAQVVGATELGDPPPQPDPADAETLEFLRGKLTVLELGRNARELTLDDLEEAGRAANESLNLVINRLTSDRRAHKTARAAESIAGVDMELELCRACPLTKRAADARTEADRLEVTIAEAQEIERGRRRELLACVDASEVARGALAEANTAVAEVAAQVATLEAAAAAWASWATQKAQADARVATLRATYAERTRQLEEHKAAEVPAPDPAKRKVFELAGRTAASQIEKLEPAHKSSIAMHAAAADREQRAAGVAVEAGELRAELTAKSRRKRAADLLERGLGPNGLQVLLIEQAGPAVEELANDLLRVAYAGRFKLRLETLRPKKTSEGFTEVFDIVIEDHGKPLKQGCGGETTWFESALRLALNIHVSRENLRRDIPLPRCETVWFDEPSGALDVQRAPLYFDMLRAARELGGWHFMFMISHQPTVWSQANGFLVFPEMEWRDTPPTED